MKKTAPWSSVDRQGRADPEPHPSPHGAVAYYEGAIFAVHTTGAEAAVVLMSIVSPALTLTLWVVSLQLPLAVPGVVHVSAVAMPLTRSVTTVTGPPLFWIW